MNNDAMLVILDHLCNEARNSVHATFGLMEVLRDTAAGPTRKVCLDTSRSCADRLLRSIDDVRDLLSSDLAAVETVQKFDPALCLKSVGELLNLASTRSRTCRMVTEAPAGQLLIRQDRQGVEQVLTRVMDIVLTLTGVGDVRAGAYPDENQDGVQFVIRTPAEGVGSRIGAWLNANPENPQFQCPDQVPFEVAVMVAGKRMRALGGSARLLGGCGAGSNLVIQFPSLHTAAGSRRDPPAEFRNQLQTLNILYVEDCDDSYALGELLLRKENVWRARNGIEAVEMIQKQRFDLVFMDVHLPGMDGYTAIRMIRDWETRSASARTPIVVLSSDDLETQRRCASQSGCSGYLRKPMRNQDLLDLLERLKATHSVSV